MPSDRPSKPPRLPPKGNRPPRAVARPAAPLEQPKARLAGSASATRSTVPNASQALRLVQRGEMTPSEYLKSRIDEATRHLRGRVSRGRLERIRKLVVEACAEDPVLLAMKERLLRPRR